MGVSPMSLKKKRCSRHLRPILRSAGRRSRSLAKRPGSSGYCVLQYSSSDAYTFSLRPSTSEMADRPLASETYSRYMCKEKESVVTCLPLQMLRLLAFKAQGRKDLRKPAKPCHVGNNWEALAEYSQMITHVPGFFLYHFVLAK